MIQNILLGFGLGLIVGLFIKLPSAEVASHTPPPKPYLRKGNLRRIK